MDAYVLGSHPGELPTHLLGDEEGNRIRAMARLEGGDFDVFYALETQSEEDVERHVAALRDAGTDIIIIWHGHGGPVESGPISLPPPLPPPPRPSWIPPRPWLLFLLAEIVDVILLVESLRERFGIDNVAGYHGSDGRYLIEVGAHDRDSLAAAFDELAPLAGVSAPAVHFAAGIQHGG